MTPPDDGALQLWGGLECSVVRLGDRYRDEFAETGHAGRADDLDRIADLGIRTLRHPVLWEHVSPDDPDTCDWTLHDDRLARLHARGVTPIVGLVHHGSGPRYTDLLDPLFPEKLARHARRVAERYPWLRDFTPVNEPVTTARFSGLYGHWYPHHTSETSFLRMVVNQCRAVRLAMIAIRQTIPDARLVQTEDLGRTFATPPLSGQAAYENDRRWLSFDLLCGRVDERHPFHERILRAGIDAAALDAFVEAPTAPDVIGVNHYLTSERYLDHRWWTYPATFHGSNGRDRYADVEAVRMPHLHGLTGPAQRLREVWDRYRLPIAVTEVHHGCWGDEQVRWLMDVWDAAIGLRDEGADIRAVTIWALFGAMDWNTLLTSDAGYYEPGAFDIRLTPPAETALAEAARDLAAHARYDGRGAVTAGWWQKSERFYAA